MRALLIALGTLFIACAAYADIPSWALVKDKSFLKFYAIENGAPLEGGFKDFTADIRFDPNHLDTSSITVTVDTGSVIVANEDVEKNITLPEWLSVKAFPKAVFSCSKLSKFPNLNDYYADGTLTLKGKTVPVKLNFRMEHMDGHEAIATGYVTLRRGDFAIGQGQWAKSDAIGDEIRVEFRVVAEKQ